MGGWKASPGSWSSGFSPWPFSGAGVTRSNGLEVNRMNSRKPTVIMACTARARARSCGGMLPPVRATASENTARMVIHSSSEPSWFPHTPEIL